MGITVLNWIQSNIVTDWLDPIMKFFTLIGEYGAVWVIISIVLLLRRGTRPVGLYCAGALLLSVIFCNLLLKPLIMRPRPFIVNPDIILNVTAPWDYSFPSGHATTSFASATGLAAGRKSWGIAGYVLAVLISFSRMYFYLHFPSDIFVGVLLGISCGMVSYKLIGKILLPKLLKNDSQ